MTNEQYLNNLTAEEKAEVLTVLFYKVCNFTNAKHHIEKWLKDEYNTK